MDEKSWTGIFVGYAQRSKGYRIFDPRTGRVETSRDVRFSEAENYYPLGNVTQGFEEEGQREILEEGDLNSGVTSEEIQEVWAQGHTTASMGESWKTRQQEQMQ